MGIHQLNFDGQNKVEFAIKLIQTWQPQDKYQLCFSGGKDSVVVENLARKAGASCDVVYNHTGIDHPEVIRFIKEHYPQTVTQRPKMTVWEGVQIHGLPTRKVRWCCKLLKEYSGKGRILITGIRASESVRRKHRCMIEVGRKKDKAFIHPIFTWSDTEVWEYIHENHLPYCSLYDNGFVRLGCILCPMVTHEKTLDEWERSPKIAQAWFRAGKRYYERMFPMWQAKGSHFAEMFPTWQEYIWWWLARGQVSNEEMKYKAGKRGLVTLSLFDELKGERQ